MLAPPSLNSYFTLGIIYLFSKENPEGIVFYLFVIKLKSKYIYIYITHTIRYINIVLHLPWIILLGNIIFTNDLFTGLIAYTAAHIYYFIKVILPREYNIDLFKTPTWM